MDKSLLDENRTKSQGYDKSCMIPSFIAGVLGVLLIGTVIGLIVMAASAGNNSCDHPTFSSSGPVPPTSSSSSPEPPISFPIYTAQIFSYTYDTFKYHPIVGGKVMLYSWGSGKYAMDQYDLGENVTVRQYSFAEDNTCVACQMVGPHANCFNRTIGSNDVTFSTDGMTLGAKAQACYTLFPDLQALLPGRPLTFCDLYVGARFLLPSMTQDALYEVLVETDTGYPVSETVKDLLTGTVSSTIYASFDPEKPQDESSLQPLLGAPVYDLRDGENCNEQATFSSKREENTKVKMHLERVSRQQAIRSKIHLPLDLPTTSISSSVVRRTVPRDDIPAQFDARQQWPDCTSLIGTITDQNPCGSCWAMSSSAVLADRMCIAGKSQGQLSPQFLVYCGKHTMGCSGATVPTCWDQILNEGTVTEDCVPFTGRNGACPRRCKNGTQITQDMIFRAKSVVVPWDETPEGRVQAIQTEIMTNGPVQANFQVFTDFGQYQSGIYKRTKDAVIYGGHAVRILGWGTEDGVDYWLVANSWGYDWGESGLFRILRGNNECNIEDVVITGSVTE